MSSTGRPSAPFVLCVMLASLCLGLSLASQKLSAQTYTDLHEFDCSVEGCEPQYPAVMAQGRDGNLYGMARNGGLYGLGTVFKYVPGGAITTLYNFSGPDGSYPVGGLTLGTDGNFYGTTSAGGSNDDGTVFKITAEGVLTTLHSFTASEGTSPIGAPVLGRNGAFYGTTCGFNSPWTSYSITSAGKFSVISSAVPPCSFAPLALGSDGNFYGTSQAGGTTYQGTVFRLTPTGNVTVLYRFDYTTGAYLYSPVMQGNDGFLYGTTSGGGSGGGGVIFKLSTAGKITLLHQFDAGSTTDGSTPFAGLVQGSDGKLYGATSGGENFGSVPNGNLFSITTNGTYNLLYAFDGTHGALAQATPMQHSNGRIYGVTERGNANGLNQGVLYGLDNRVPPSVLLTTLSGTAGQTVQILASGLTGTSKVKFGSATASFHVVSDTYLTATVPNNGTTGLVSVTTPSRTLVSNRKFFVLPVISSFTPTSGPVGTQVIIVGTGLLRATQVKFGSVKATSFTVNSATSITASVPSGAMTGKVSVTTPGGTAMSQAVFTVTP
jgi:uncharacterized repeat protein (TIGR03803 family)